MSTPTVIITSLLTLRLNFKAMYFTAVDTALQSLRSRSEQHCLTTVKELEECVLSGEVKEAVKSYPEVDVTRLAVQLPMFRSSYDYNSIYQATAVLQSSSQEEKQLFSEVEKVLHLLLLLRVCTCEAERSLRLKERLTYHRSTINTIKQTAISIHILVVHYMNKNI